MIAAGSFGPRENSWDYWASRTGWSIRMANVKSVAWKDAIGFFLTMVVLLGVGI
jgi:hypothetical protein